MSREQPKRKAYPSDLTDEQWARLESLIPAPRSKRGGRPSALPFGPSPNPRWLAHLTTIQTGIRLPVLLQLCSTGFAVGFCVTAFYPRFGD
jgi:hypothetical protein